MSTEFTVANNLTVTPDPAVPQDQRTIIWSSGEIAGGSQHAGLTVNFEYKSIVPDADLVSPVGLRLQAIIEQKQSDGSWQEVGRQNAPVVKLSTQAPKRTIVVTPSPLQEEGVDSIIPGFDGAEEIRKSKFENNTEGFIRICLVLLDKTTSPLNPFQSVTFSCHGKRYDV